MIKTQYTNTGFFGILALIVIFLVYLTYDPGLQTDNSLLQFFVNNHRTFMLVMAFSAAVFGYFMNKELKGEIIHQEQETKQVTELLLQTQGTVERKILKHLIQHGSQTQAQLSQIKDMTRVKVHRSIQRLEKQGLVTVRSQGKMRQVIPSHALKS